jgi:tetratricopeptide (TPR) repeat protein
MEAAALLPPSPTQVVTEGLMPLADSRSLGLLGLVLAVHGLISLVAALGSLGHLPRQLRQPRWAVLALLWNFAFIVPVLGAVALVLIARNTREQAQRDAQRARPQAVALPEYEVQAGNRDSVRSSQVAIRSRLQPQVPGPVRMQSLLTLQAVPPQVANPLLESLLGDDADDVRLLAFGMLDSSEKRIARAIQHERDRLQTDLSPAQRFEALRHLAELYWELVYAELAQGELRRHTLRQARDYLEQALQTGVPPTPGLLLLLGRILLAQEDYAAAEAALRQAMAAGLPAVSALPYLAEIAYARRDYAAVREHLRALADLPTAAKTAAVVNLWTGRDTLDQLHDRNFLPHL